MYATGGTAEWRRLPTYVHRTVRAARQRHQHALPAVLVAPAAAPSEVALCTMYTLLKGKSNIIR